MSHRAHGEKTKTKSNGKKDHLGIYRKGTKEQSEIKGAEKIMNESPT